MSSAEGAPLPGRRPDDRRARRPAGAAPRSASPRTDPSALYGSRPRADATRRLPGERRVERDGARRGSGGRGRGGPRDSERDRRVRRRRLAALGALGALLVTGWFLVSLFQPLKGGGEGEVEMTIPSGAGVGEIGDLLEQRGVVSSSFFFELRARLGGSADELKSGTFTLREDMSYAAALDALSVATAAGDVTSVTIPEGQARGEVAPIVEQAGVEGDYEQATVESKLLDPAEYGAEAAESLEGFLFPATYELKRGASAEDLVKDQLKTFQEEFDRVDLSQAERANLTPYDVLTIASMVEREAQLPEERPLIASVIYNRLREGIPLGIDATIRFATENWTEPLTQSELAIDSPYNTRTVAGLPPGPIGSPGIDSIEAAANPEQTGFLYYVVKPGTCGEHEFAETDAEFQAAVDRYNAERAAAGGESPTDCPE
jgi:UPF0755 protein